MASRGQYRFIAADLGHDTWFRWLAGAPSPTRILLRGVLGAMSNVPGQPFEQHGPRLAKSTKDQKKHLPSLSMSTIPEQPSEEHASEFESLGPYFFSQISKKQGDARIDAYDTYLYILSLCYESSKWHQYGQGAY